MSIKKSIAKVASKVGDDIKQVIEAPKENVIVNIQNSTAFGLVIKWAIAHPVTLILITCLVFFSVKYKIQSEYYERQLLETQIVQLKEDLDILKKEREKLQIRIKEYESKKKQAKKDNAEVRKSLKNKTPEELTQKLEEYTTRLKEKRN